LTKYFKKSKYLKNLLKNKRSKLQKSDITFTISIQNHDFVPRDSFSTITPVINFFGGHNWFIEVLQQSKEKAMMLLLFFDASNDDISE